MEELEPRLLFSADLPGVLAQSGLLGGEADSTPPAIVALMDRIRAQWGVKYPME